MKYIVAYDVKGLTESEIFHYDTIIDKKCTQELKKIHEVSNGLPINDIQFEGKINITGKGECKYIAKYIED